MTDTIAAELAEWQATPLLFLYLALLFDTLPVRIDADGALREKTITLALGLNANGDREIQRLWIDKTAGAKFWHKVFSQLRDGGVEHIQMVMADAPEGLSGAVHAIFPTAVVQASIPHLIRLSLSEVAAEDREPVAAALRPIYTAASAGAAQAALDAFAASPWGATYASIVKRWAAARQMLVVFYALPREARRIILFATDAIEDLHRRLHRKIRTHGSFPSDQAAIAFAWLALRDVVRRWSDETERTTRSRVLK
jgi:transposase-like protein